MECLAFQSKPIPVVTIGGELPISIGENAARAMPCCADALPETAAKARVRRGLSVSS